MKGVEKVTNKKKQFEIVNKEKKEVQILRNKKWLQIFSNRQKEVEIATGKDGNSHEQEQWGANNKQQEERSAITQQ